MKVLDIAIILGIVFFMVLGFRDGFSKKMYGIIGFLAGLVIAAKSMYFVGQSFSGYANVSKETGHIVAFCVIFMIIVLLENLFYRWFGTVSSGVISFWARMGGIFIGSIQGLIMASLFLVMLSIVSLPTDKAKAGSTLYDPVLHFAPAVYDMSTSWFGESRGFMDMLKDNFHPNKPHSSVAP